MTREAERPHHSSSPQPDRIPGKRRIQCAYHKCLTLYVERVFTRLCKSQLGRSRTGSRYSYRHFRSELDAFYRECADYSFASINNQAIDLDRFADVRVIRFVRDPRDLVVSGYHYHKRSAEPWCDVIDPTEEDWRQVNGTVPSGLPRGRSFAQYLNEVPVEEGLLAELEFRRRHFESMREWPDLDPRVRLFRYEEVLGNEANVFGEIFEFFEMPLWARLRGLRLVRKHSAAERASKSRHIRDPSFGQWRKSFTPAVKARFEAAYGDLPERLGYPVGGSL